MIRVASTPLRHPQLLPVRTPAVFEPLTSSGAATLIAVWCNPRLSPSTRRRICITQSVMTKTIAYARSNSTAVQQNHVRRLMNQNSNARRHHMVGGSRGLEITGIPRQPGCMAKRRQMKPIVGAERSTASRSDDVGQSNGGVALGVDQQRFDAFGRRLDAPRVEQAERGQATTRQARRSPSRTGNGVGTQIDQARASRSVDLRRIADLSKELDKLHKHERALLAERDVLVRRLRSEGESWASLSSRTGLSRQALSKRTPSTD